MYEIKSKLENCPAYVYWFRKVILHSDKMQNFTVFSHLGLIDQILLKLIS